MASKLVGPPRGCRSPGSPPALAARQLAPSRSTIYWPAVAGAAGAAALFVVALTVSLVVLAGRPTKPAAVAAAPPAAPLPVLDLEEQEPDLTVPPPPPVRIVKPFLPALAPDPVQAVVQKDDTRETELTPVRRPELTLTDPAPEPPAKVCETFGTSVAFASSPAAAEKQAAQDGKLLFLLHVSGNFEDDAFT